MAIVVAAPVIREQREVVFDGWRDRAGETLHAPCVMDTEGRFWIPFTFLVKSVLGIDDVKQQRERVYGVPALARRMAQLRVTLPRGGAQLAHMIQYEAIPFYFGMVVSANKVRSEARDFILDWQEQALTTLSRQFHAAAPAAMLQAVPSAPDLIRRIESGERFSAALAQRIGRLEAAQPFTLDEE